MMTVRRSVLLALPYLLLLRAAWGESDNDRLAVRFAVDSEAKVLESEWFCVNLMLMPEDGGEEFSVVAERSSFVISDVESRNPSDHIFCKARGGIYINATELQVHVTDLLADDTQGPTPSTEEEEKYECKNAKEDEDSQDVLDSLLEKEMSPLETTISNWNWKMFDLDSTDARMYAIHFHGDGSEQKHLAYEVSYFKMPTVVQNRIEEKLATHHNDFFVDTGAGEAGTTGAAFLSGNVGFGNAGQGTNLMDLLFSGKQDIEETGEEEEEDLDYVPETAVADEDQDARARGGVLQGESYDSRKNGDMLLYEDAIKAVLRNRGDVSTVYGDEADFKFQHRLWRFGPEFDAKRKGGIWHRDTCPFGINGVVPDDAIMFTLVYILYTENLMMETAGTRVQDPEGKPVQLPCQAGHGNMLRTGESDLDLLLHSGPLDIKKLDNSKPSYRVMMQTKTVVTRKPQVRKLTVGTGDANWKGLDINVLTEVDTLPQWLDHTSRTLTKGVGESNALGSAAYPVNVHRAWAVTRDLCNFFGLKSGFIPPPEKIATPVIVFGYTYATSKAIIKLQKSGFRVNSVAVDEEYSDLRTNRPDEYANMMTFDLLDAKAVAGMFAQEPFDMHLVIDCPVADQYATNVNLLTHARSGGGFTDPVLRRYHRLLAELADKPKRSGRIASVTYMSTVMPEYRGTASLSESRQVAIGSDEVNPIRAMQILRLRAERDWHKFGADHSVGILVLRIADRIYGPQHIALDQVLDLYRVFTAKSSLPKPDPGSSDEHDEDDERHYVDEDKLHGACRDFSCSLEQPVTRIHLDDLANIIYHGTSLLDKHDQKYSEKVGPAEQLFAPGNAFDIIDDARPSSMLEAQQFCALLLDVDSDRDIALPKRKRLLLSNPNNLEMKHALGIKHLQYPTYRHGAAASYANDVKFYGY